MKMKVVLRLLVNWLMLITFPVWGFLVVWIIVVTETWRGTDLEYRRSLIEGRKWLFFE